MTFRTRYDMLTNKTDQADNRGQDIVKVMCHTTRQRSQRLQFLRPTELFL
jgi:hypothetical protein